MDSCQPQPSYVKKCKPDRKARPRVRLRAVCIPSARAYKKQNHQQALQLEKENGCPFAEIAAIIDLSSPFNIELIPNGFGKELTLYFGLMEFVQEAQVPTEKNGKIKCIVWDLDNTLWQGVLVEDGPAKLVLRAGIKNIIEELDRRGILQSIASKNNHDEAIEILN
jgi:hypothetical protein